MDSKTPPVVSPDPPSSLTGDEMRARDDVTWAMSRLRVHTNLLRDQATNFARRLEDPDYNATTDDSVLANAIELDRLILALQSKRAVVLAQRRLRRELESRGSEPPAVA